MSLIRKYYYIIALIIGVSIAGSFAVFSLGLKQPSGVPNTLGQDCMQVLAGRHLGGESTTRMEPFLVSVKWLPDELKTADTINFNITMSDKQTGEPLSDVTYDMIYKGTRDLGEELDRHVDDFSTPDTIPLKINYPCHLTIFVHIDSVGERSFEPINPNNGNMSPVAAGFVFINEPFDLVEERN